MLAGELYDPRDPELVALRNRARELCHLVEGDTVVVAAHAVGHRLEPAPRHVHGRAMGQVAAGGKVEA